jgi:hypothetical protein
MTNPAMPTPSIPATPITPFTNRMPPPAPLAGHGWQGRHSRYSQSPPMRSESFPGGVAAPYPAPWVTTSRHVRVEGVESPSSPDIRHRRHDNQVRYPPARIPGAGASTPYPPGSQRRYSLPRPEFMPGPNAARVTVGAPPRPQHRHGRSPSGQDPGLTLAPIKTSPDPASTQAKSVEAMVMSMDPLRKLAILARVSPPLAAPGPASPAYPIRGAVIAVEGVDTGAVKAIVRYLDDMLGKEGEHAVRIWEEAGPARNGGLQTLADYLQLIHRWHDVSADMVRHMTTIHPAPSRTPVSPRPADAASPSSAAPPAPFPIAIVPQYQLSVTDAFASTVPITDSYAPVDHWKWMAASWRGIVGPDITIIVRGVHGQEASPGEEERAGERAAASPKGGVEVRLADHRALIVRVEERGRVRDSGLRRVGFEIGEWIRGRAEGRKRSL